MEDTVGAIVEFASGARRHDPGRHDLRPGLGAQVWVSDARGRTASVMEFPEGVGFTDMWTVPGEEEYADGLPPRGHVRHPARAEIHRHLVPYHTMQIEDFIDAVRDGPRTGGHRREAVKSLEIVQAIYESSRTGATHRP